MPKKIKFESYKYRLLIAANELGPKPARKGMVPWHDFILSLCFSYERGQIHITWPNATGEGIRASLAEPRLFTRGDNGQYVRKQAEEGLLDQEDLIKEKNDDYFYSLASRIAKLAGYQLANGVDVDKEQRLANEQAFHDAWANSEDVESIDVRRANEVCTAPEMRFITKRLGDIRGKTLLDVGCGLGEASVYFALLGAEVTSSDLSQGMLDATSRLAKANGVAVKQHLASAEDMRLSNDDKFDIIYAGNLLHHVDIDVTLSRIRPHLADGGVLVTWDPLAYNPAINIYRAIATDVRTPDEHPLKWSDIKLFHKHFGNVETRYFWLTTLVIFVIMALAQRRNPNQERFWKVIINEGEKWAWLYKPLEKIDRFLLTIIPPLRLLCWNVVVISRE